MKNSSDHFLSELRSAADATHKALEKLPVSESIMSPEVTVSDYIQYLSLTRDMVYSVETSIYPTVESIIPDIDSRRKLQLIEHDLKVLKVSPATAESIFEGSFTIPFALGIIYVAEGSTLGNRYLLGNVNTVLGINHEKGASYLNGYGTKSGSSWKNFLNLLTRYANENACGPDIIAGANFAFSTIYNHYSQGSSNQK